jgi:hypothetical protein
MEKINRDFKNILRKMAAALRLVSLILGLSESVDEILDSKKGNGLVQKTRNLKRTIGRSFKLCVLLVFRGRVVKRPRQRGEQTAAIHNKTLSPSRPLVL